MPTENPTADPSPTEASLLDTRALLTGNWAIALEAWPRVVAATRMLAVQATPSMSDIEAAKRDSRRTAVAGAVAVVSLQGIIRPKGSGLLALLFGMSGGLEAFRENFREVMGDDSVGSVVLDIDSPGGLTDMVPETAAMIREARGVKPIIAVSNTMAASAAYYIASAADEVVVTPSGFLGSIGVFTVHDDFSALNDKIGIKPTYISAGKYKTEANPDEPLSKEAQSAIQKEIDTFYDMFVEDVAEGRGVKVSDVRNGYGEGRTLTAARAVAAGLGDRVDTLEGVVRGLATGGSTGGSGSKAESEEPKIEPVAAAAGYDMFSENFLQTMDVLRG